jgi:hypothetical protein
MKMIVCERGGRMRTRECKRKSECERERGDECVTERGGRECVRQREGEVG